MIGFSQGNKYAVAGGTKHGQASGVQKLSGKAPQVTFFVE